MSPGYRAFLMGTATDQPLRAWVLSPVQKPADRLFGSLRKWNKVISSAEQ